jgi:hypothetical protein
MPPCKLGDAWSFALDSRLYRSLDHRARVHLHPQDLERVRMYLGPV